MCPLLIPDPDVFLQLSFIEQPTFGYKPNALFLFALARSCLLNAKSFYVY